MNALSIQLDGITPRTYRRRRPWPKATLIAALVALAAGYSVAGGLPAWMG